VLKGQREATSIVCTGPLSAKSPSGDRTVHRIIASPNQRPPIRFRKAATATKRATPDNQPVINLNRPGVPFDMLRRERKRRQACPRKPIKANVMVKKAHKVIRTHCSCFEMRASELIALRDVGSSLQSTINQTKGWKLSDRSGVHRNSRSRLENNMCNFSIGEKMQWC